MASCITKLTNSGDDGDGGDPGGYEDSRGLDLGSGDGG